MTRVISIGVCAGALLFSLAFSSFAAPMERRFIEPEGDRWMSQQIKAPADELPVDEALAAVSRAASINVFADVSHMPAATRVGPYAQRPKDFSETNYDGRRNVINYALKQAVMTQDRTDSNTFVFWRAPETNRVVNLIVQRQDQIDAQFPALSADVAVEKLKDYYRDAQGWVARPQNIEEMRASAQGAKPVNIAQLPPDVRLPVQAELIRRVSLAGMRVPSSAFDISSWQNARIVLLEEDANYFRPDGWVLGRAKARVLRVSFPGQRSSFLIGVPHWANPKFPVPDALQQPNRATDLDTEAAPLQIGKSELANPRGC